MRTTCNIYYAIEALGCSSNYSIPCCMKLCKFYFKFTQKGTLQQAVFNASKRVKCHLMQRWLQQYNRGSFNRCHFRRLKLTALPLIFHFANKNRKLLFKQYPNLVVTEELVSSPRTLIHLKQQNPQSTHFKGNKIPSPQQNVERVSCTANLITQPTTVGRKAPAAGIDWGKRRVGLTPHATAGACVSPASPVSPLVVYPK